jgi:protein disulfide-isomerase
MQAVQSQELKWHTNVEAIAIGNKEHKPLMMFYG